MRTKNTIPRLSGALPVAAACVALLACSACSRESVATSTAPSATSAAPSVSVAVSASASAAALPPPPLPILECRAVNGAQTIELFLTWDKDVAAGTLRTMVSGGSTMIRPVKAELSEGQVLVSPAAAQDAGSHVAVVRRHGKKAIQVGDAHQPWLACD
jgi:hypothetical protein